ncbi:MAG TPA: S1C family serine protease [Bauldia sp.]|nr:S1C family serine protease [Bauldia sp.]
MAMSFDWKVPPEIAPSERDYDYDLNAALSAVVGIRTVVPSDAFTADILGTERTGNGVLIRDDGLVLTIGYLVTEASEVWLSLANGRTLKGDVLGFDQETGFGLIQALGRPELPALSLGDSADAVPGTRVVAAGAGGRDHSVAARVIARQEFAGYWEYLVDEAIFTAPAHPYWGGTALIGPEGGLLGIGSLQLEQAGDDGEGIPLNMYVPTNLLKPVLDDMLTMGQPNRPPRPWLGLYATEVDNRVVIAGVAGKGPAARAKLKQGDVVVSVGGAKVSGLAGLFRKVWSLGKAGVDVPMTVVRDGRPVDLTVTSGDRNRFLKGPSLH